MFDLLVRGGTVVTAERSALLDVAVEGERIVAVAAPGALSPAEAKRVIDAEGCLVLPGGVDPHCHYGFEVFGVQSETQDHSHAAALGGTTTILDFVFQAAPLSLADAIAAKHADARGRMSVDYGFHAVLTGEIPFEVMDEIGDTIRGGIPTIKTMTTYHMMCDDGFRLGVMEQVAAHGGMSVVHAEDDAIANWLTRRALREGKTHGAYIAQTRPALVEEAAIRRVLLLAEHTGSPLYILHMAAASGVRVLDESRRRGLPVYGETLTPYLSFTSDALWDDDRRGLLWNNYPTIKEQSDQDELWAAIADGRLQAVGSDHFLIMARDRYEKMGTTVDALQCGQAGVELRLPVLYHLGVAEGRLSATRFVELVATGPARLMGLYPRKGTIAVGSDADIVVLDPRATWTVQHEELHMTADYSCWDGWELTGKVRDTVLRGTVVVEGGTWVGQRGGGEYLPRTLLPDVLANPRRV